LINQMDQQKLLLTFVESKTLLLDPLRIKFKVLAADNSVSCIDIDLTISFLPTPVVSTSTKPILDVGETWVIDVLLAGSATLFSSSEKAGR